MRRLLKILFGETGDEARLAELDERTMKDIGLEPWRNALGAKVARRRHELRRWSVGRVGLW